MRKLFLSLDRSLRHSQEYLRPDRYRQVFDLDPKLHYIAQGAGVSYIPLSFGSNATVVDMSSFDRVLYFDPEQQFVEVEAGISLGKLYSFLLEKGFYLPVQPGHPQITVGGCISCNVHGKNQFREGLFCDHVRALRIFHPKHGVVNVSRQERSELFALSCGGFGLTGILLSATLSIRKIPNHFVSVDYLATKNLEDCAEKMFAQQAESDLLYSWNNLGSWNDYQGEGFLVRGKFADTSLAVRSGKAKWKQITIKERPRFPINFYYPPLIRALNFGFSLQHLRWKKSEGFSFFDFNFPISRKTIYYDFFGPQGFIEHQVLIPTQRVKSYFEQFRKLACRRKPSIVLASAKVFSGERSFLNFSGKGLSFSIDLPQSQQSRSFLEELDVVDQENGVIANLSKDSRISRNAVRAQYSEYDLFRTQLRKYDSERIFVSQLSERLNL